MSVDIRNNEQDSQFETTIDGHKALVAYRLEEGRIVLVHTEVPQQLAGRGLAGDLVKHALAFAREKGLSVDPQCSYAAAYVKKHPEEV